MTAGLKIGFCAQIHSNVCVNLCRYCNVHRHCEPSIALLIVAGLQKLRYSRICVEINPMSIIAALCPLREPARLRRVNPCGLCRDGAGKVDREDACAALAPYATTRSSQLDGSN